MASRRPPNLPGEALPPADSRRPDGQEPEPASEQDGTAKPSARLVKVLRLPILKPVGAMTWKELDRLLDAVRYRVFRLGNLAMAEAYLRFHLWRTGKTDEFEKETIGKLSKRLRAMLQDEGVKPEQLERFGRDGALPAAVTDALGQYKVRALTSKSQWQKVVQGKAALPTFKLSMAIPVRCDKPGSRRLERGTGGDVEVDLTVCRKPYPRVILATGKLDGGPRAVLERLLDNTNQSLDGYRQRCFDVRQDQATGKWFLHVVYDMPRPKAPPLDPNVVVGVDVGFSCPIYLAVSNGLARRGWRHYAPLAARVRALQRHVLNRRREMQRGGRSDLSRVTARSGHGRARKLHPIRRLEGRIDDAYTTLNHQLSASVIDFALGNGAGTIQIEDLKGLGERLTGTFLGARRRYHQLHTFIQYKGDEAGIRVRKVKPAYTSRRCSQCGKINRRFTREQRDRTAQPGGKARFECPDPQCGFKSDPDYNAARNLAVLDIDKVIAHELTRQGGPDRPDGSLFDNSETTPPPSQR